MTAVALLRLHDARASSPPCRYNVSTSDGGGSNTVTDNVTGLTWQQTISSSTYTWPQAASYCQTLSYGGLSGWRLPTTRELLSIVDLTTSNPAIDQTYFPNTPSNDFWAGTPYGNNAGSGSAWFVGFTDGDAFFSDMTAYNYYVRCVR
jgi:hypothetical protein